MLHALDREGALHEFATLCAPGMTGSDPCLASPPRESWIIPALRAASALLKLRAVLEGNLPLRGLFIHKTIFNRANPSAPGLKAAPGCSNSSINVVCALLRTGIILGPIPVDVSGTLVLYDSSSSAHSAITATNLRFCCVEWARRVDLVDRRET